MENLFDEDVKAVVEEADVAGKGLDRSLTFLESAIAIVEENEEG